MLEEQFHIRLRIRGGEKNQLLINRDYNIDDYDSIIKFPKIDFDFFFFFFFFK